MLKVKAAFFFLTIITTQKAMKNNISSNKQRIYELIKNNDGKLGPVDLIQILDLTAWEVATAVMLLKSENSIDSFYKGMNIKYKIL